MCTCDCLCNTGVFSFRLVQLDIRHHLGHKVMCYVILVRLSCVYFGLCCDVMFMYIFASLIYQATSFSCSGFILCPMHNIMVSYDLSLGVRLRHLICAAVCTRGKHCRLNRSNEKFLNNSYYGEYTANVKPWTLLHEYQYMYMYKFRYMRHQHLNCHTHNIYHAAN